VEIPAGQGKTQIQYLSAQDHYLQHSSDKIIFITSNELLMNQMKGDFAILDKNHMKKFDFYNMENCENIKGGDRAYVDEADEVLNNAITFDTRKD
jgi:hypothetical protein